MYKQISFKCEIPPSWCVMFLVSCLTVLIAIILEAHFHFVSVLMVHSQTQNKIYTKNIDFRLEQNFWQVLTICSGAMETACNFCLWFGMTGVFFSLVLLLLCGCFGCAELEWEIKEI